jgi:hypothetical protein
LTEFALAQDEPGCGHSLRLGKSNDSKKRAAGTVSSPSQWEAKMLLGQLQAALATARFIRAQASIADPIISFRNKCCIPV